MKIICVDRSPWGLLDMKRKVKAVNPDAAIRGCRDPDAALALARDKGCDVLLTEIDLGGAMREGLDFARKMQIVNPQVNIIFVTTFAEWDYARDVIQMRVSGFVRKPYKLEKLADEFRHLRYPVEETLLSPGTDIKEMAPSALQMVSGGFSGHTSGRKVHSAINKNT